MNQSFPGAARYRGFFIYSANMPLWDEFAHLQLIIYRLVDSHATKNLLSFRYHYSFFGILLVGNKIITYLCSITTKISDAHDIHFIWFSVHVLRK